MGNIFARDIETCLRHGRFYIEREEFQKASENFQEAFKLAKEQKDNEKTYEVNLELGDAFRFNNHNKKAIEHYGRALEIARKQKDKQKETLAFIALGDAYIDNKHIKKATECYEKALKIAREQEDKPNEIAACIGLGHAYRNDDQMETAITHYENALKIEKKRVEETWQSTAVYNLIVVHAVYRTKEIVFLMQCYERNLKVARIRKDKLNEAIAQILLGDFYMMSEIDSQNCIQRSIEHYKIALKITREIGDKYWETHAHIRLGHCYSNIPHLTKDAIYHNEMALKIARERKDKKIETNACIGLGDAYRKKQQTRAAIEQYQYALITATIRKDKCNEIEASIGLEKTNMKSHHTHKNISWFKKDFEAQLNSMWKRRVIGISK